MLYFISSTLDDTLFAKPIQLGKINFGGGGGGGGGWLYDFELETLLHLSMALYDIY